MAHQLRPSYLKGYISISSFIVIIQGLISVFLGMNHMIVFNTDSSWIYDYFDVTNLKINLTIYGTLLLIAGTAGMSGIFKMKNKLVFVYNIGNLIMFIYALGIIIPIVSDEFKGLPDCKTSKKFQSYENIQQQMQNEGLCTVKCPCMLDENLQKLFPTETINRLVLNQNNGKTQAIKCILNEQEQKILNDSEYYQGMVKLENFYNCQGMCELYNIYVYQFTDINRGPPFQSTCYSELKKELDYFYTKALSALASQIGQFIISMIIAGYQYKIHPSSHKNKNMGFYIRLSQL